MPRKARIDAPGGLHHIIARGIVREKVFDVYIHLNPLRTKLVADMKGLDRYVGGGTRQGTKGSRKSDPNLRP
jgi:hypothetical protein